MRKYDKVELSEIEIEAIKNIIDDFENDERVVRDRQIRDWKRLELMWYGFTNFYWDYVAHDWRIFGTSDSDEQSANYDKNINVFRAYGETIIAALSATVPPIKALPDDADNVNDVLTAKAGSKIAELCYTQVNAPLLWVRILFTYYLQGLVASYNWTDEDKTYGVVNLPDEKEEEVDGEQTICSSCGAVLQERELSDKLLDQESNEFDPDDDDVILHDLISSGQASTLCPECLNMMDPELKKTNIIVTRLIGNKATPKSRQRVEINGGLYVRVPNWARSQEQCPYLFYDYETHFSTLYEEYPELWEIFKDIDNGKMNSADGNNLYERWGRLNPQYRGDYPRDCPTVKHRWIRKSAFNSLQDEKLAKKLKKKFPDGCYTCLVNDEYLFSCNENMDDHWTLMINPLSNSITYDPLGTLETAIQEITTNLLSLELQCIEHSVPITFFNPKFLNSEQFRNTEVAPGGMYMTKTIGENRNISDGFHSLQTATVSPELAPFGAKINEMGQFVVGAMPQVWGGTSDNSSRTASQYAMQRNGAQVRLSALTGRTVNTFWKTIWSKVIPAYMKNMLEDERIVKPGLNGSFIQTTIKRSQMEGKIGDYYLEAPEGLPQSLDQVRETVKEMFQSGNQQLISILSTPENLPYINTMFGLTDIVIPGEKDREKQNEEIQLLIQAGPIPSGQVNLMTGQMDEQPSVMPEFEVDNHQIEAEICRDWLVGEKGRQCKSENEPGYRNVLLHLKIHMQMFQMLSGPPATSGQTQAQPDKPEKQLRPVPKAS